MTRGRLASLGYPHANAIGVDHPERDGRIKPRRGREQLFFLHIYEENSSG